MFVFGMWPFTAGVLLLLLQCCYGQLVGHQPLVVCVCDYVNE